MSKYPIKWHEECLRNIKLFHENLIKEDQKLKERIRIEVDHIAFYEKQINSAKAKCIPAFDRDRFGIKKGRI